MEGPNKQFRRSLDGFIPPQKKPQPKISIPQKAVTPQPKPKTVEVDRAPFDPSVFKPILTESNEKPKKTKKKRSLRRKIVYSGLGLLIIGFGIGAWYGSAILTSINKAFHGNVFSDVHALLSTSKLKGESQGRVNILLAGDSSDDPGHAGADLTDSIMVVSIDTKNNTGFMLSVPRDLWVNVPGVGHEKINGANDVTNFSEPGYPNGGMGQLEQIVTTDLGIPIDYYALINYEAFKDSVNAVGGITINIQSSNPKGLYDSFTKLKLPNGEDQLDGQQALDLARARGDSVAGDISYGFPNSDFDRTQHQREMLVALTQKAKTAGVITNPIKVTDLFKSFGNNVQTDFDIQDALRLSQIMKMVNISKLQSLTYSYGGTNGLIKDYTSPDGEEALAPAQGVDDYGQLQQYYQQLTSSNPVVREAPSVDILNGSNTTGLARKEGDTLTSDGYDLLGAVDAQNLYQASMIIDNTGGKKPASLQLLKTLMPKDTIVANQSTKLPEANEASGYTADFVIVLGQDYSSIQTP
jgi:LCP family protein required for cell wall assembly